MYAFGMIPLLGLAVLVVCWIVARYLGMARELTAAALVVLGIAAAWIADFDLFGAWGTQRPQPRSRIGIHRPCGGRGILVPAATGVV